MKKRIKFEPYSNLIYIRERNARIYIYIYIAGVQPRCNIRCCGWNEECIPHCCAMIRRTRIAIRTSTIVPGYRRYSCAKKSHTASESKHESKLKNLSDAQLATK